MDVYKFTVESVHEGGHAIDVEMLGEFLREIKYLDPIDRLQRSEQSERIRQNENRATASQRLQDRMAGNDAKKLGLWKHSHDEQGEHYGWTRRGSHSEDRDRAVEEDKHYGWSRKGRHNTSQDRVAIVAEEDGTSSDSDSSDSDSSDSGSSDSG